MEAEGSLGGKPAVGSSAAADGGVDAYAVIRTGAQQYLDLNVVAGDSTPLFDSAHLLLLRAIRPYLRRLSGEGSAFASSCLRSLNWDLLDSITRPVFLELSEFHPFRRDYCSMPSSAKLVILQQLCDDLIETECCRSELSRRMVMAESERWKMRRFSPEEDDHHEYNDGNGDECYRCYTICDYLVVAESCGEEASFVVYGRDDLPAVVASLLSSLLLHEKTIRAVCGHWNLPHGESHHQLEISQRPTAITEIAEAGNDNIIPTSAISDGGASSSASQEIPLGTRCVNLYEFAFMASSFWEELASDKSDDDARIVDQIMARPLKIVTEKNAVFFGEHVQFEFQGREMWLGFACKNAEDGRDCLFVANGSAFRAIESFTSVALGIQWRNGMKKHLVDVVCPGLILATPASGEETQWRLLMFHP